MSHDLNDHEIIIGRLARELVNYEKTTNIILSRMHRMKNEIDASNLRQKKYKFEMDMMSMFLTTIAISSIIDWWWGREKKVVV